MNPLWQTATAPDVVPAGPVPSDQSVEDASQ